MSAVAVLEVLDRDGSVRHGVSVSAWPLNVGRALDNHLVLDDAHTAAHHFSVLPDADGKVVLSVGESLNGVQFDGRQLRAGERQEIGDTPPLLVAGRTHLRLRLAGHALPPEKPLLATRPLTRGLPTLGLLALAAALALVARAYLESDPDTLARVLGARGMSAAIVALGWPAVWTLLSKVFTRRGHFGWHLGVLLTAVLAWEAASLGTGFFAFTFSWPWLSDFGFLLGYAIFGAMFYFHLLAVEPHHPRPIRMFTLSGAVAGALLHLWFNWQGTDRLGAELYMTHLFPPALRAAQPVDVPRFMQGLAGLQAPLDARAEKDADDNP